MSSILIHPFKSQHYPAINAIGNAAHPEYLLALEEERMRDQRRDRSNLFARWVAEQEGRIVGVGQYSQSAGLHHPGEFWVDVYVHPGYADPRVTTMLYRHVLAALGQHHPSQVRANVQAGMTDSIEYLKAQGFRESWRREGGLSHPKRSLWIGLVKEYCAEGCVHVLPELIAV